MRFDMLVLFVVAALFCKIVNRFQSEQAETEMYETTRLV